MILLLLVGYRIVSLAPPERVQYLMPLVIVGAYSTAVALSANQLALLFYPVLINLVMLYVFTRSLTTEKTIIEQFVIASGQKLDAGAKPYLYVLTIVWCIFFFINACISAYTACFMSLEAWTLYNGFISYIAIAVLFALELIFRPFYKQAMMRKGEN